MIENKKSFEIVSNKNPRILLPNTLTIIGVCIGLSSIKFAMDQKNFLWKTKNLLALVFL